MTVRYYVPANQSDTVSVTKELPIPPYGISYSATQIILPFKAVRLARVRMWCNYRPDKDIEANTISLTCVQRRTVRPIEWSDTATPYQCAHIEKKFNVLEPLGLWYVTESGETNPELTFVVPQGGTLELTFSYILCDGMNCGVTTDSSLSFPKVYTNRMSTSFNCLGRVDSIPISM
jgi:hypothetical protein